MNTHPLHGVHGAGRRAGRFWQSMLLAAGALLGAAQAHAIGSPVDVQVIDRDTGTALPVYPSPGAHHVAGRPGSRYAIRVSNRSGARVLAVMSVDGVNIVSGQTAAWDQGGYVLGPWQTHDIVGWRKSPQEVAAFEFTALSDSYAARTGRPGDVGVIGVAVFAERQAVPVSPPQVLGQGKAGRAEESAESDANKAMPAQRPASGQDASSANRRMQAEPDSRHDNRHESRLGTGHGEREVSHSATTRFVRSSRQPIELVSIRYDSFDRLVSAGVVGGHGAVPPRPFPRSASPGFVPDPPHW